MSAESEAAVVTIEVIEHTWTSQGRERRMTITCADGSSGTRWHSEFCGCAPCRAVNAQLAWPMWKPVAVTL